ncbi:hypothetical protein Tco_0185622 [Tanacetum coccineum]
MDPRIRGDAASRHLSLSDAIVPLIEPLSAENLVGEASTSGVPAVVAATTALLTTFVQASSVLPILHSSLIMKLVDIWSASTKPLIPIDNIEQGDFGDFARAPCSLVEPTTYCGASCL